MNYPIYFKREETNQVIKVNSHFEVYTVQVIGFNSGAFKHAREKISFPESKRYEEFIKDFVPAVEEDYIEMLRCFFIAERDARELFLKKYCA